MKPLIMDSKMQGEPTQESDEIPLRKSRQKGSKQSPLRSMLICGEINDASLTM